MTELMSELAPGGVLCQLQRLLRIAQRRCLRSPSSEKPAIVCDNTKQRSRPIRTAQNLWRTSRLQALLLVALCCVTSTCASPPPWPRELAWAEHKRQIPDGYWAGYASSTVSATDQCMPMLSAALLDYNYNLRDRTGVWICSIGLDSELIVVVVQEQLFSAAVLHLHLSRHFLRPAKRQSQ